MLVIHLRMSGQLLRAAAKEPVAKHTHVVITFTQGGQLRFVDPRTFGEMFVTSPDELTAEVPELAELGFDPVENPISWTVFGQLLVNRQMKLKAFLTDQTIIAGLGNIYADEILFAAGLRYDRQTDSLSTQEIRRLYRSVVEILHEAIKYGGSTLADEQYVDLNGKPGEFQEHHRCTTARSCPATDAAGPPSPRPSSAAAPPSSARSARSEEMRRGPSPEPLGSAGPSNTRGVGRTETRCSSRP